MVNHLSQECASISDQKKEGFKLRDLSNRHKSSFSLRLCLGGHKKSHSDEPHLQPHIVEEPIQGSGNEDQDKGDMYGGDSPTSFKGCFKNRTMDAFFSSIHNISRTPSKKSSSHSPSHSPIPSASPRPSFVYRNGTLHRRSIDRNGFPETLSRNSSRWNDNPILYSHSARMKTPPPVERQLECTLEELCYGCTKKIKITRDVLTESGQIVQEEEILSIQVKPGWKKGTKITFEGKGNERPGCYAADVTFVIAEKPHRFFRREGDDLEMTVEIPLLKALTGCTLPIPLLGEEKMNLEIDEVIHPGYQRQISGQGMPNTKEHASRGNLMVSFLIKFPTELTDEQRAAAVRVLEDSC